MHTLNYSIHINAPREKVWNAMLGKETYEEWTRPFNPTSRFEGDWSEGSKMVFLGEDPKTGEGGGMFSRIKENRQNEYLSIEHLGMVNSAGVEEPWKEEQNGFENYTLIERDGGTDVEIEMTNIPDEYKDMMEEMWPKALAALKELAEKE